mmetsp:Transcript_81001/g.196537  ORF Transcript_81001/g.196537 Transcript_81001/m.196537 type:complete len:318 (-) Transcript_81001:1732-2685(-)
MVSFVVLHVVLHQKGPRAHGAVDDQHALLGVLRVVGLRHAVRLRVGGEAVRRGVGRAQAAVGRDQPLAVDLEQRDGPLVEVRVVVEHLHVDARGLDLIRHGDVIEVDDAGERARQVLRVVGRVDQYLVVGVGDRVVLIHRGLEHVLELILAEGLGVTRQLARVAARAAERERRHVVGPRAEHLREGAVRVEEQPAAAEGVQLLGVDDGRRPPGRLVGAPALGALGGHRARLPGQHVVLSLVKAVDEQPRLPEAVARDSVQVEVGQIVDRVAGQVYFVGRRVGRRRRRRRRGRWWWSTGWWRWRRGGRWPGRRWGGCR